MNIHWPSIGANEPGVFDFVFDKIDYDDPESAGKVCEPVPAKNMMDGFIARNTASFDIADIGNGLLFEYIDIAVVIRNNKLGAEVIPTDTADAYITEAGHFTEALHFILRINGKQVSSCSAINLIGFDDLYGRPVIEVFAPLPDGWRLGFRWACQHKA